MSKASPKSPPATADLLQNYHYWRKRYKQGWGLTWYLAAELCERFYVSHGIAPIVVCFPSGPGFYGIGLTQRACRINEHVELGRLTAGGNVENWVTGGPGDHGLNLIDRAEAGVSPDTLIEEAIRHLNFPLLAPPGHTACRHKRWGSSYVLVFRLAALIALRWGEQALVLNHPDQVARKAEPLDPMFRAMHEHPGHFVIQIGGNELVLASDGRVLLPSDDGNLWTSYMAGKTSFTLLHQLEDRLGYRP